jgi:hypothetical protein
VDEPHEVPLVARLQPAVSVSVVITMPQVPPAQTASVRLRVREPVVAQASA